MGRLIVTDFVTLDGVIEAPGFDEHRSGRNAWALRLTDDDMQRYNVDQLAHAAALLLGPNDLPDLGRILAVTAR